ncbi:hypothetical protein MVEN_00209300 [Mycena venus]|uniref:Uncharacterized protein n=1 Tax=Mycena venus TaxID=2733690 RepID=A0A8H6Z1P5_9AGAR|nr:hypothetical protein MVEN_00209300 [Mycena venus]
MQSSEDTLNSAPRAPHSQYSPPRIHAAYYESSDYSFERNSPRTVSFDIQSLAGMHLPTERQGLYNIGVYRDIRQDSVRINSPLTVHFGSGLGHDIVGGHFNNPDSAFHSVDVRRDPQFARDRHYEHPPRPARTDSSEVYDSTAVLDTYQRDADSQDSTSTASPPQDSPLSSKDQSGDNSRHVQNRLLLEDMDTDSLDSSLGISEEWVDTGHERTVNEAEDISHRLGGITTC